MVKNTIGGKKFKKGKKIGSHVARHFPKKSEYSDINNFFYGQVKAILGGKNVMVLDLETNKEIIGIICGSMYKKQWLKKDDVLLCSKRIDLDNNKCDIIFKYTNDEVKILKRLSEIHYHDNIKNSLLNNIFSKSEDSSDEEENSDSKVIEIVPQKEYLDIEELGDSDIDDI